MYSCFDRKMRRNSDKANRLSSNYDISGDSKFVKVDRKDRISNTYNISTNPEFVKVDRKDRISAVTMVGRFVPS